MILQLIFCTSFLISIWFTAIKLFLTFDCHGKFSSESISLLTVSLFQAPPPILGATSPKNHCTPLWYSRDSLGVESIKGAEYEFKMHIQSYSK